MFRLCDFIVIAPNISSRSTCAELGKQIIIFKEEFLTLNICSVLKCKICVFQKSNMNCSKKNVKCCQDVWTKAVKDRFPKEENL